MKLVCKCGLVHNGEDVISTVNGVDVECPCCKRHWITNEAIAKVISNDMCSQCWEHNRVLRGDGGMDAFESLFVNALRSKLEF